MKPGREYEQAVAAFARNLGPDAKVLFDHIRKDIDTGQKRQADVWIEGTMLGTFPIKVLVSCKDKGRKQGVPEIELLSAQVRSYGANKGVIYSRSGFTKTAIQKAEALQITCCRLYDRKNSPPVLPPEAEPVAYVLVPEISGPTFQAGAILHERCNVG